MNRVLTSLVFLLVGWTAARAATAEDFAKHLQKQGYIVVKKGDRTTEVRVGSNYQFTPEDYQNLSLFSDLEFLALPATDEGLAEVARLTKLKTLSLRGTRPPARG